MDVSYPFGGQELSYAEVKAIASGNAAVLTLAEADAELQRLAVLIKSTTPTSNSWPGANFGSCPGTSPAWNADATA